MEPDSLFIGLELSISRGDRWQLYHRLQELDIPCTCSATAGVSADIATPTAALQLWSVARHLTASRQQLSEWLTHCWKLPI